MGRRALANPRRRICVRIDEDLLLKLSLDKFDPVRGKAEYGALSDLLNRLLRQELEGEQINDHS